MAVLLTPPFLQFFDEDGNPLVGGKVYTYAAGTTQPKATFTDSTGATPLSNPIILDSAGRTTIWITGSYKFVVTDADDVIIRTTDNVTAFNVIGAASNSYFQSFSGNGTQTAFTLSQNLGDDENSIMVFVNKNLQENVANGDFATDTIWTKGAGWTIGAGVATAAGAISTAISQTSLFSLVPGQAYAVTYTITRSAGGLIPSIGGQSGVERTVSGTYREVIVAGATQTIAFTGNGFTGTLDAVSVTVASTAGFDIQNPSTYTLNGTSLTFAIAPASGTNNIMVFAPSTLVGQAAAAAAAADASATAAANSASDAADSASSAAAFFISKNQWTFSTSTTMSDPSTGFMRFNNAAIASTTAIAISDLSANSGNPDLGAWVDSWDDNANTVRGTVYIFKDNANFAYFNITGATIAGGTWNQLVVTYLTGAGSFSNNDAIFIGFNAAGVTTVTGGITSISGDLVASGSGAVVGTLAVGINPTVASLNSGQLAGFRNKLINGDFRKWDYGTTYSHTTTMGYAANRWAVQGGSGTGIFNQDTSITAGLGFRYDAKVGRNNGSSSTTGIFVAQAIETLNSIPLAGKTFVFSFYAKKGANFSGASDILNAVVLSGTGTDESVQALVNGTWTGISFRVISTATLTTSWQRFQFTATIPSNATQIGVRLDYTPVGTAGADDNFYFTGAQFEIGSVATPFEDRGEGAETLLCARYLPVFQAVGTASNVPTSGGGAGSTTVFVSPYVFNVDTRIAPTGITVSDPTHFSLSDGVNITACTAVAFTASGANTKCAGLTFTVASGLTQFRPYRPFANNASGKIIFTGAEL